jgi:hypothetical protein
MRQMKLYVLQPDTHYGIYVGYINEKFQAIVSHYDDLLIAVLFDVDGNLVEVREKSLADVQLADHERALTNWVDELNLIIRPISIKKFFLSNYKIGIKDLSVGDEYFLSHQTEFSKTEQADHHEWIKDWQDSGEFVFWWNNDFWCDQEGDIIAS